MRDERSSTSRFSILLVCTGNICRSPLAERLGRAYLDSLLGQEADTIRLASAGTRAVVGASMHPDSALVLRGLGGEPGDFIARQLTEEHLSAADLTLTMTRRHREEALRLAPRALSRTFTLREAAGLAGLVSDPGSPAAEPADRALAFCSVMADARSRRHGGQDDDVPDPVGRPVEVHQQVGELIAEALLPLLDRLVGMAVHTSESALARTEE